MGSHRQTIWGMDWLTTKCITKTEETETSLSFRMWSLLEEIVSLVPLAKEQEEFLGVRVTVWIVLLKKDSRHLLKYCRACRLTPCCFQGFEVKTCQVCLVRKTQKLSVTSAHLVFFMLVCCKSQYALSFPLRIFVLFDIFRSHITVILPYWMLVVTWFSNSSSKQ